MIGLTPKQKEAYDFIRGFLDRNGWAPSYDEIGDALQLHSKSGVARLVWALEERGAIRRIPNKVRAIEIICHGDEPLDFLPDDLRARLDALCRLMGDGPRDVIIDAIELHLDASEAEGRHS